MTNKTSVTSDVAWHWLEGSYFKALQKLKLSPKGG